MKHIYLTYFTLLISIFAYTQNEKVESLENHKKDLELRIKILKDSVKDVELKISRIESEKFLSKIKDSSFTSIARKRAKLKKEPSVFGDIITTFDEDKEVIIIGYKNGWFQVCYGSFCGFMNEIWINQNSTTINFIKSIDTNTKLTNEINSKPSNKENSNSSQITPNTYQPKIKKIRNYRTYYRGPRGGCYYINSNGNKSYVSRSLCN
ncbi:hypothetical protein [uncultured Formosa sp.]|uniref:hypothetical protein n=1 Tax=uncultured Formosa sp. TaxID=255435 RepID=UPI0026192FF2|nr:hypothetical protein [uncultured Formosa sp.]